MAKSLKVSPRKGCVVLLTGLSGSGKSTLANALCRELTEAGHAAFILDGDKLRTGLCADLDFSDAGRRENMRRLAEVGKLFADCGVICLAALIAPVREARDNARRIVGSDRFMEVYLDVPLAVCEQRDVKGLYGRARRGELPELTGIGSPYEAPSAPDLRLDTAHKTVAACVDDLLNMLKQRQFIE